MEAMLGVCERYAAKHNITFSVDANPVKSKTKMLYVCGDMDFVEYPAQIMFCGRLFPFVKTALHLGHTLAQDGTMVHDAKITHLGTARLEIYVRGQLNRNQFYNIS